MKWNEGSIKSQITTGTQLTSLTLPIHSQSYTEKKRKKKKFDTTVITKKRKRPKRPRGNTEKIKRKEKRITLGKIFRVTPIHPPHIPSPPKKLFLLPSLLHRNSEFLGEKFALSKFSMARALISSQFLLGTPLPSLSRHGIVPSSRRISTRVNFSLHQLPPIEIGRIYERAESLIYTLADAAVVAADGGAATSDSAAGAAQKSGGWFGFISDAMEVVLKVTARFFGIII